MVLYTTKLNSKFFIPTPLFFNSRSFILNIFILMNKEDFRKLVREVINEMARGVRDEFSDLPVSPQRRNQMRREKRGLCGMCGKEPIESGGRGKKCKEKYRLRYHKTHPQARFNRPHSDEFSDLPPSQRFLMRVKKSKKCIVCGEPAVVGIFCLKHAIEVRERQRQARGYIRRYDSLTYRLQRALEKRPENPPPT